MKVRSPAVAGQFYPDNPSELRKMVVGFTGAPEARPGRPKAIIAPHAGYVYSGPIAGSVYRHIAPHRASIHRVVLIGPSHRIAFRGIAAPESDAFDTPLGRVAVDHPCVDGLVESGLIIRLGRAHRDEHGLEVHLPFLQVALDAFRIVPLVVGDATGESVEAVLDAVWDGPETFIVISSDLSHYHSYATACRIDRATAEAIERLAPDEIETDQACGRIPIQGLLRAARSRGLRARTLDVRNSGDTAGPRTEVVGYGGFIIE